jgi:3-dehydroquinate synthase
MQRNLKIERTYTTKFQISSGNVWDLLQKWFDRNQKKLEFDHIPVLSDQTVWRLYGKEIQQCLAKYRAPIVPLIIPDGEKSKDFSILEPLIQFLISARVHRRDILICLGGGVCCDLGGLVAMLYMRGINYLIIPTSLMAQIDAAIGGKVGSNFEERKNLLGGFHHPLLVLVDALFLKTLPLDHLRIALAEALKVAIILEHSGLFALLENKARAILSKDPSTLQQLTEHCIENKIELLKNDPFEMDLNRSLNLGHAVAHSLERLCAMPGGRKPLHGEAVAIGLATVIRYAHQSGYCSRTRALRLLGILDKLGLPQCPGPIDRDQFKDQLRRIAEHRGGLLRLVVPVDPGGVTILPDADLDTLVQCLQPNSELSL